MDTFAWVLMVLVALMAVDAVWKLGRLAWRGINAFRAAQGPANGHGRTQPLRNPLAQPPCGYPQSPCG